MLDREVVVVGSLMAVLLGGVELVVVGGFYGVILVRRRFDVG